MKVKKIKVENYMALKHQELNLDGCSAILTAGNDKGKSSILKGLIDRFRGEKPELIVKEGEKKGINEMELTDGSKIEWGFTTKSEKFSFTTPEGIKQDKGVIKTIGERYFGMKFDIDKFLNSSNKKQVEELQKIVGVDFTEIDQRYKIAYDKRTDANKEVARLRALKMEKPEKVEKPDVVSLKEELKEIKSKNAKLRESWITENNEHHEKIRKFNDEQDSRESVIEKYNKSFLTLKDSLWSELQNFVDFEGMKEFIDNLPKPEDKKAYDNLPEPEYHDETVIEEKIESAQEDLRKYDNYERDLEEYNKWLSDGKKASAIAKELDQEVKSIENEKKKILADADIPEEFEITEEGVLYKGLPLDSKQISSSGKYIAALKLGQMVLGELKTMHFDASYLDKNNLAKVQGWARVNDLQLLIERPSFDGGDITYEIVD